MEMSLIEKTTVVYVEDEPEVREQIAIYLQRRVKSLREAENGAEGLELVKECDPEVIITDLEMPIMNGLEMIKKIRELYDDKKKVIVITGYMDDEHYTDLADAYLYKPINLSNLVATIEELLAKKSIG